MLLGNRPARAGAAPSRRGARRPSFPQQQAGPPEPAPASSWARFVPAPASTSLHSHRSVPRADPAGALCLELADWACTDSSPNSHPEAPSTLQPPHFAATGPQHLHASRLAGCPHNVRATHMPTLREASSPLAKAPVPRAASTQPSGSPTTGQNPQLQAFPTDELLRAGTCRTQPRTGRPRALDTSWLPLGRPPPCSPSLALPLPQGQAGALCSPPVPSGGRRPRALW